ncbi:MAG: glycosyltransferase [Spirulina sp. SIO3F2]|nr:glycosyltransferase [Spirulina sp. SIO3F2]
MSVCSPRLNPVTEELLTQLPDPPRDRTGWPWTVASDPGAPLAHYPRISIVIPSYNQAQFLEETLRSVLLQNYPNLECLVIDGGSSDESLEILQQYDPWITWISEPDQGQSDAVNKGFRRATGDWVGWQNSDDTYEPNTFTQVAQTVLDHPETQVVYGNVRHTDRHSQWLSDYAVTEATIANMIPYSAVTNHSVFYSAQVFADGEFLDLNRHHCMDQEFILRLLRRGYHFTFNPQVVGNWRLHDQSKSTGQMRVWAKEAFELCQEVYADTSLTFEVRQKARDCLLSLAHDTFSKVRLDVFQWQMQELTRGLGWRSLGGKLLLKYGLSFLGEDILACLKTYR